MTNLQKNKVLLVEDDATMQAVLHTLLEIEGFQVVLAPDCRSQAELVSFIKGETPDVILLDVHVREVNGIDVLRELRQDPIVSTTRIVMTSGLDVKEKCLAAGANGFLMKPYMPDDLIKMLHG